MHPKHKLTYFNKEGWLPEWKEEAKRLLREHWDTWYKPEVEPTAPAKEASLHYYSCV